MTKTLVNQPRDYYLNFLFDPYNKNLTIKPNKGDGNCFFYAYAEALGINVNDRSQVQHLRFEVVQNFPLNSYLDQINIRNGTQKSICKLYLLAEFGNNQLNGQLWNQLYDIDNVFHRYLLIYGNGDSPFTYETEYNPYNEKANKTQKVITRIRSLLHGNSNLPPEYLLSTDQKNAIKNELDKLENLWNEYKHLENVESFKDFLKILEDCKTWADAPMIKVIEEMTNVRFIMINQDYYLTGGKIGRSFTVLGKPPNPAEAKNYKYIIMNYSGNHFELIINKESKRGIWEIDELPAQIKKAYVFTGNP